MIHDRVTITTPEGVEFGYELAGPTARLMAQLIDGILMSLALFIIPVGGILFSDFMSPELTSLAFFFIWAIVPFFYNIVLEWTWRGRTVGKYMMKIRVVDQSGMRLQFAQIVLRNALRAIDFFPFYYLLGGIMTMLHPLRQRLGDVAARTVVVRQRDLIIPDFVRLEAGKYNSLRALPHLTARVRQRITPDMIRLCITALVRRDSLEASARVKVFHRLREELQKLVAFPNEVREGLSDEQFVRNIVDVLASERGTSNR